jgi:hypothetical protein
MLGGRLLRTTIDSKSSVNAVAQIEINITKIQEKKSAHYKKDIYIY